MIHSQNFSTHNQKPTNVVKYLAFFCGLLLAILFSPSPFHLLLFWANVRRTREAAANAAQRQLNERNRWGCQTTFSIWLEIVNFSQISQEFCQLNADQSDRCSQSSLNESFDAFHKGANGVTNLGTDWPQVGRLTLPIGSLSFDSPDMEIIRGV